MRISYSEDEDHPGQFELWQASCRRSLQGMRGQASLRELEAALLAMPNKRLIAGALDDEQGDVCAIGALVRYKGITPKSDAECEMEEVGVECGMPRLVAWKVVELNDLEFGNTGWKSHTPEQRYEEVLKWVRANLRESEEPKR